ncbi:MAG: sterol desaturase family protein [Bacteroidota bacterium]
MRKLYVSNKDETVRMFKSDFLEAFSKVHFSIPLIVFLPVIGYFLYLSFISQTLSWLELALGFAAGMTSWTLVEYVLHRWIFHFEPSSEWGKRLHFICHGVHHDYPNDSNRLVMPPILSIPLAFFFYYLYGRFIPGDLLYPVFSGLVSGYLIYDMIHYAIHHVNFSGRWWMALKTHHLKHHFKDPDKGFGVTSTFWDIVSGSDFQPMAQKKQKRDQQKTASVQSE